MSYGLNNEQIAAIDRALEQRAAIGGQIKGSDPAAVTLFGGSPSTAGVAVNEHTALTYAAVWRAVTLLSQMTARLPMHVYRRTTNDAGRDSREHVRRHDAERLLNVEAGPDLDACVLRETMMMYCLTWGHAEAEILRRGDGSPYELRLLLPWTVRPERLATGQLVYVVSDVGGDRRIPAYNVLSIIGPSPDGVVGYSPIRLARESIGLGLATERFGASFFSKGARPGGALEIPSGFSDKARERLVDSFRAKHEGASAAGQTIVLEEGAKFNPFTLAPEEAQFLQSRQFQISEIARWFGIPPHLLFDLTRATFSNIEEQGIDFLNYSLAPWLSRFERAAGRRLLLPSEQLDCYVEANTNAVVRADITKRYASYKIGRDGGWLSVNEIRRAENEPEIGPAGDVYLQPLNMAKAGEEKPQDEPQPTATPAPAPSGPSPELERSIRSALADAVGRSLRVQGNAATRAAKKPAEFRAWLDEFTREHRRLTEDVVASVVRIAVAGLKLDRGSGELIDRLAGDVVGESRERLLEAVGHAAPEQLAQAVEAEVAGWAKRAAVCVSTIFAETNHERNAA